MVKNLPLMEETGVQSLGQKDTLEKRMASHSVFLPAVRAKREGKTQRVVK